LEHVERETVSRAKIATLQRLDDVYIRKVFAKHLKSLSNSLHEDVSVFTERILNSIAELQNFPETLYIALDKSSENV